MAAQFRFRGVAFASLVETLPGNPSQRRQAFGLSRGIVVVNQLQAALEPAFGLCQIADRWRFRVSLAQLESPHRRLLLFAQALPQRNGLFFDLDAGVPSSRKISLR